MNIVRLYDVEQDDNYTSVMAFDAEFHAVAMIVQVSILSKM